MSADTSKPAEQMVTTDRQLQQVCKALREAGTFGFDTEFIRERSYLPQVCLVQAAAPGVVVMIDPFEVDMSPFWDLVLDATLEKIVHAGQQDLEMCYLHTGRAGANIFDVQVAAGMAGLPYPLSYEKLVRQVLGVRVPAGQTYSEWSRRPLTDSQLRYAVADVLHLTPLRNDLKGRLKALGRLGWLKEELRPWEEAEPYAGKGPGLWQRIRGWKALRPRQLAILREVAPVREEAARKADVPPRTLLRDEVLAGVARKTPRSIGELQAIRGFPRPLAKKIGRPLLAAVEKGLRVPEADLPRSAAPKEDDPVDRMLTDLAAAAGQSLCIDLKLDHGLFAVRSDYVQLVRALHHADGRSSPKLLTGWRKEFAGQTLLDMLTGRRALRVTGTPEVPHVKIE